MIFIVFGRKIKTIEKHNITSAATETKKTTFLGQKWKIKQKR